MSDAEQNLKDNLEATKALADFMADPSNGVAWNGADERRNMRNYADTDVKASEEYLLKADVSASKDDDLDDEFEADTEDEEDDDIYDSGEDDDDDEDGEYISK